MADQAVTVAQLKGRIFPAGLVDATDDTLLTELIEQATDWMQHYTGRKFLPETAATYVFDTMYGNVLYVPRGIRSITSMGVATTHQPDAGGTYTTIPAADILLRPKASELAVGWPSTEVRLTNGALAGTVRYMQRADNGATITGNFGFAAVPPDIQAVALEACATAYAVRKGGVTGAIGPDDTSVLPWSQIFGPAQRDVLKRYAYLGVA